MTMQRTSLNSLREEMLSVARGERAAPERPARSILAALSTPETVELLQVILERRPRTIAELATLTGRAQPNVSRSLQRLAAFGLVRLVREGREVRPEPVASGLVLDFRTGSYRAEPVG